MNFVFVSLQRIDTDRESTSTCLAQELAKNHRVLYVNSPLDRRTLFSRNNDQFIDSHVKRIREGDSLSQLQTNLWVLHPKRIIESINWVPATSLFNLFNRINNRRLARDIKEALRQLGFESFTLINDKDIFRSFYLKEMLRPARYIYLDRDYTVGMDYWKKHGAALEPELMRKSDAVVCNSMDFVKRARLYNPNSFYIGNGGDVAAFIREQTPAEPEDLRAIPGPVVGYIGALTALRLDIALMAELASARPDWSFVLVGPEDETFRKSALHTLPNVYFLGKKHKSEVSSYIAHFDVCINPQAVNDITIGNFPMKIVEYLASGKPVVATATNTMKEVFANHTYLAGNAPAFVEMIEKALAEKGQAQKKERILFAKSFSWEQVTSVFMRCIEQIAAAREIREVKKTKGIKESDLQTINLKNQY